MTWNKKHDEFALECKLRPSSTIQLRWILRRAKPNEICEIEIDLRVFNNWVGKKRGSAYDRKTIRESIAQLDAQTEGMICIMKSYTPWVHKLIVRPLSFVLKEKCQKRGTIPKPSTGNPMYSDDHKKRATQQQQQNISKLDTLLRKVGLKYDPDALNRIWILASESLDNVAQAVELLLYRHSTAKKSVDNKVGNSKGYLIHILTKGYYKDFDMYYEGTELPFFQTGTEIIDFVKGVFKPPQYQT